MSHPGSRAYYATRNGSRDAGTTRRSFEKRHAGRCNVRSGDDSHQIDTRAKAGGIERNLVVSGREALVQRFGDPVPPHAVDREPHPGPVNFADISAART